MLWRMQVEGELTLWGFFRFKRDSRLRGVQFKGILCFGVFQVRCDPEIQELRQWQKKLREDKHIRERVRLFWAKQEQKGGLSECSQGLISRDSDLLFQIGLWAPCECRGSWV